jgi:hypothetical protein
MRKSSVIILLGAAAFAGWVFYSLDRVEPIHVVASHLEHQGADVFVAGKLENDGPNQGPVDVEVRYYDKSGRTLGSDKVAVGPLKRGAAASFRSPARAIDGVADYSIYLNHGRNPYGN